MCISKAIPIDPLRIKLIVIDSFCGAGGWTEGIEQAVDALGYRIAIVGVGVNHDHDAIKAHKDNHPETVHFVEDVRDKSLPRRIRAIVQELKLRYPNAKVLFHASLECTNFSNAKGGKPRDPDSRSLANFMPMYLRAIKPDYFTIENVREFMAWGPMIAKVNRKHTFEGHKAPVCEMVWHKKEKIWDYHWQPESRTKGQFYQQWLRQIKELGYHFDSKMLNAADFGGYTSRNRFFAIFNRPNVPVAWPQPTHAKRSTKTGKGAGQTTLFGNLQPWRAVRDVLDFDDEGHSIFGRKYNMALRKQDRHDLVEKSLERIYAGLVKHVAGGEEAFLSKYYSGDPDSKNIDLWGPAGALTTADSHALVKASFLVQRQNDVEGRNPAGRTSSIDDPARTITTTGGNLEVVQAFISKYYGGKPESRNMSLDEPCSTLTTENRCALVRVNFLSNYYSGGGQTTGVDGPAGTLTTKDRLSLVQVHHFMDQQYGASQPASIDGPAATVTQNPKLNLVRAEQYMVNYYSGGGQDESLNEPTTALTTIPKQRLVTPIGAEGFIYNPGWFGHSTDLTEPAPVIVARQDKSPLSMIRCERMLMTNLHANVPRSVDEPAPALLTGTHHYLVQIQPDSGEGGELAIVIYPSDSPMTQKIKILMAALGIVDIKMRMLKVPELKRIQGFPSSYKLGRSTTKAKKFIGNSVHPLIPKAMAESLAAAMPV
ncbi:DNA (cytosine-5-)-methyltransferase [Fibrella aestuarina BUZ 2]|uniref:DNA (cytosine-5-)-methyltransferase n=1 Tax=Fibrella aestuarina BUZ 2 TaxID=1166018 RepID=I0KD44_9BACT|nr:DNA cytosine methyltransferase [Fibrella aestuarina]CCH02047.1 DNA (cytosine-5-)-methyltransferase [Fibrella aestuarina BUZ 2]